MARTHRFPREDGTVVEVVITERADGDFHIDSEGVADRRANVMPGPWAVVRQVHGATVAEADPATAPEADAVITETTGQPIAVQGADCAPVAFIGAVGSIAVAHVGWRGLEAGVIDHTIEALTKRGTPPTTVFVGPMIGPECYEFGADDLERLADTIGPSVRSTTSSGTPALDVAAGIRTVLEERYGIDDVRMVGSCTACADGGWSHRARQETQRHALAARIVGADDA